MIGAVTSLLSVLGGFLAGPIKRWQEEKIAVHDAKMQRIRQGDLSATDLDRMSIAQRGWKDDYLLLLTTVPLVLVFVAPFMPEYNLVERVSAGFAALAETPEYYWYALGVIYIDTFGFRRMVRVAVEKWLNTRFN